MQKLKQGNKIKRNWYATKAYYDAEQEVWIKSRMDAVIKEEGSNSN